ncbi:hypothetical protein [Sagittula sp. SSi028]|uniref:hypothetical protein n=1 Tax=Sagittula sp. SSi028 TaxID=3400636 RepID=UPI003AF535CF
MARRSGGSPTFIYWLKIILPLVALAMLSTLFLLSDSREPLQEIPFLDGTLADDAIRPGVTEPFYSGVTDKGELVTITAQRARPLGDGQIEADVVNAHLRLEDGGALTVTSPLALSAEGEHTLDLSGGVTITSTQGYVMQTEELATRIDRIEARSAGRVVADGPLGDLDAGQMEILPADEDGAVRLLFTKGVKVIYRPAEKDADQ